MTVAQNLAERLIGDAEGPALDILFRSAVDVRRLRHAPSSELVRSRWSSLTATSAIAVASVLTDQELIDQIAAKEKRKTVRVALASNPFTHPVTRLYFYQEGRRTNDWDLTRAATNAMTMEELLDYAPGEHSFISHLNDDRVAKKLTDTADVETLKRLRELMEDYSFNGLASRLIISNPTVALQMLEEVEIDLEELNLARMSRLLSELHIEQIRRLMKFDNEKSRAAVVNAFSEEPAKLAALDPTLLDDLAERTRFITREFVDAYFANDRVGLLLRGTRFNYDQEAADRLLEVVTDPKDRILAQLHHPEPAVVCEQIDDVDQFVSVALESTDERTTFRWIDQAAPHLGLNRVISMLEAAAALVNDFTLNSRAIVSLSDRLGITCDEFLEAVTDELLSLTVSLPELNDPNGLYARVRGKHYEPRIATAFLALERVDEALMQECVLTLVNANQLGPIRSWSMSQSVQTMRPILDMHAQLFAEMVQADRDMQRADWVGELIELFAPRNGWGHVKNSRLTSMSLEYLQQALGDDVNSWESALVLYEGWTGTLGDLVKASRTI